MYFYFNSVMKKIGAHAIFILVVSAMLTGERLERRSQDAV